VPAGGDKVRRNARGEPFEIEFLDYDESIQRVTGPYVKNLEQLGIRATMRTADAAQYQRRLKAYDFDVVTTRFVLRQNPEVATWLLSFVDFILFRQGRLVRRRRQGLVVGRGRRTRTLRGIAAGAGRQGAAQERESAQQLPRMEPCRMDRHADTPQE